MKLLTMDNYTKAFQMIKDKGYDKHNAEKLAVEVFHIVEQHGKDAEFYIEALPDQNN